MRIKQHIDKLSKILLVTGILITIYGQLARSLKIYFFWESLPLGGMIVLAAAISLFYDFMIYKLKNHKEGVYILKLISVTSMLLLISFVEYSNKKSEAYMIAEHFIYNSDKLKEELGDFEIGPITYTSEVNTLQADNQLSGKARFGVILKGKNRYKDFEINVIKSPEDTSWEIEENK